MFFFFIIRVSIREIYIYKDETVENFKSTSKTL